MIGREGGSSPGKCLALEVLRMPHLYPMWENIPQVLWSTSKYLITGGIVGKMSQNWADIDLYFHCESMSRYLLVLELSNQSSNMRFQRNTKLVTLLDELRRRLLCCTNTGRSSSNNDSTGR